MLSCPAAPPCSGEARPPRPAGRGGGWAGESRRREPRGRAAAARAALGGGDTWQRSAAFPAARLRCPGAPGPYVTGAGGLRRGAGGRRRAGFPAAGRLNTAAASLSSSSCCASSRSCRWELSPLRPGSVPCPPLAQVGSQRSRSCLVAPCWEEGKLLGVSCVRGL